MPKAQNSPIRMYFLIQATENNGNLKAESECKACGLRMKGNHASNMERHVRRSHPVIYEKYLELKRKTFNPVNRNYEQMNTQMFEQFNLSNFDPGSFEKQKKKNENDKKVNSMTNVGAGVGGAQKVMKRSDIVDACVELVTINGRPFSLMNDSGFRALVDPIKNKVSPTLVIDESNVKKFVNEKAAKLKSEIMEDLKGKVVCLKLDCITHCNRSFVGINIQRYIEEEMKLYALSVVEVNVRQDTSELSNVILTELSRFGIHLHQIYSVTVDNGLNFAKHFDTEGVVDGDLGENETYREDSDNGEVRSTLCVKEEIDSAVQVITVYNEFDEEDNDLDTSTLEIILEKLHLVGDSEDGAVEIQETRCAANILQATVTDFFKAQAEINELLKEARNIVKKLNMPNNLAALRKMKVNVPGVDYNDKWKSTFFMLDKLLRLKDICVTLSIVSEESDIWTKMEELLTVLTACKCITDLLQTEQLIINDVYKLWYNCILEISKIDSTTAVMLVQQMRLKQDTLFEDVSFISAIFLDPRFNNMVLNNLQKEEAISHLRALHERLVSLAPPTAQSENATVSQNDHNYESESAGDEDELEKIFKEHEKFNNVKNDNEKKGSNIELALRNFCANEPRLKTNENILNFWERKKLQYPDIYNLACVLLSVPATQKSMNSLVSQVKYILGNDKMNMSFPLLNNVILIRANAEL